LSDLYHSALPGMRFLDGRQCQAVLNFLFLVVSFIIFEFYMIMDDSRRSSTDDVNYRIVLMFFFTKSINFYMILFI